MVSKSVDPTERAPNQRAATLYGAAALLALIGLADAIYLTIEHVTGQSVRCTVIAGCSEVLSSTILVHHEMNFGS